MDTKVSTVNLLPLGNDLGPCQARPHLVNGAPMIEFSFHREFESGNTSDGMTLVNLTPTQARMYAEILAADLDTDEIACLLALVANAAEQLVFAGPVFAAGSPRV